MTESETRGSSGRSWLRLADRRIRTKLALILVLPLLAVLVLAGVGVASAVSTAAETDRARTLVGLGGSASGLVEALQRERSSAAVVFSQAGAVGAVEAFGQRVVASDVAATAFRRRAAGVSTPPSAIRAVLDRVAAGLGGLGLVRQQVMVAPDAVGSVVAFRYRALIAEVLAFRQGLARLGVSESTSRRIRAAAGLSEAVEALSRSQVTVARNLGVGRLTPAAQREIVAADTAHAEAVQSFAELAPPGWREWLNTRVRGPQVVVAERLYGVVTRAQPGEALEVGTDVAGWVAVCESHLDLLRQVVFQIDADLVAVVTGERDSRRTAIGVQAGLVGGVLLAVVAVAWWVARHLGRSLVELRARAEYLAGTRLPELIAAVEAAASDPAAPEDSARVEVLAARAVEGVGVPGRDEVGQVAEAFGQVAGSAVRLAGQQALLRVGISSMLVALSRRLQRRADAMMVSLDALERDESDPDRLGKLFELDHVAALIRRLIANLQVLAGGRAGLPRPGVVELTDLLRAAYGEVDDYPRITLAEVDQRVSVDGEAAEEITHLLAELLDNAVRFSPPERPVTVTARGVADRVCLQIADAGPGMSRDQLAEVYDRLEHPGQLHRDATRRMGIPVVAAIAARLGIRIDYRSRLGEGTRVDLILPAHLINASQPERRQSADDTQRLPAVPPGGLVPDGPPDWPPPGGPAVSPGGAGTPAPAETPVPAPTLGADPAVGPARAEQPPLIFEELRRQARHGWFATPEAAPGGRGGQPPAVAGWVTPSAAQPAVPVGTTASGLPRRHPGQRTLLPTIPSGPPAGVVRRDPNEVRRRTGGFQRGRATAQYQPINPSMKEPIR
jgi:signal transduction histidine kinase